MDVFNKLKTAVSNVLPGNPLSRDFEVLSQIASAGPGLLWKVYNGVKKTTKQEVAIFVLEKKLLERYNKPDRDIIMDVLKRGVSQLTRLRHPRILSVLHPLEESRESLAFATEPVFASLANIVKCYHNLPPHLPKELEEHKLYEVEIKYGLLQLIEALAFLHTDVNMMHHNICPESIIVNRNGAWKLCGFDFCIPNSNTADQTPSFEFKEWECDIPPVAQPHLDFLAPEYSLTMSCSQASDMFSLGALIFAIFNNGKPLYECRDDISQFKKNSEEMRHMRQSLLGCVPEAVREHVKLLLNAEPSVRPDAHQLTKIPFFEDVGSMTLQYLDTLFQRDNLQKSKFFKGLPKIVAKMPKRVNQQRILPPLFKECVNPDMIPFVLPSILYVAEQSTDKEYLHIIFPELIPMFKLQKPVQILLIFLQNMTLLLGKTSATDIKNHVLPMVYHALESNDPQIQELVLNITPTFANLIDYTSLKNSIVPRIKKMCLATSSLSVRVGCLVCLGKLLEYMDKWYVLDEVFPLLPQIPSREPGVLMSILGIFKVTLSHTKLGITKDILATKVIPFLMPLCIENNLNLNQFNAYISVLKEMVAKVETEQRSKLEQLNSMQQEQKTIEISKMSVQDEKNLLPELSQNNQPETMMDKFLSNFNLGGMVSAIKTDTGQNLDNSIEKITLETNPVRPLNQPAKVNLSLEEKQRLAHEQEQQQLYKKQAPLVPNSMKDRKGVNNNIVGNGGSAGSVGLSSKQPKDLTSTLLNNNLNQLHRSTTLNSTWNPPPTTNPAFMSTSLSGSMGSNSMTGGGGGGGGMMMQRTNSLAAPINNKPVDLSAFDNLLSPTSSSQAKPSLNQMAKKSPNSSMPGMGINPTGMGLLGMGGGGSSGMRMMGPSPMMGQAMQMPMMGAQPMGGANFSPMGMGMGATNQNQFASLGNVKPQNGLSSSNSIGNELDDLFG